MTFISTFDELNKLYESTSMEKDSVSTTKHLEETVTNEYKLVNKQGAAVVADVFGSKEEAAAYANKHKITDVKIARTELVNGKYNGSFTYGIDKTGNIIAEEIEIDPSSDDEVIEIEEDRQLILECTKCGALVIKIEADLAVDDKTDLVNIEEPCQYCEATEGYKIIGVVVPYETAGSEDSDEVEALEEPADAEDADVIESLEQEADKEDLEELLDFDVPISINANGNDVAFGGLTR